MKKAIKFIAIVLVTTCIIIISMLVSNFPSMSSYEATIVGKQYLRDYPSKHANIITTLNNGDKVIVTQEYNGWLKVYNDKYIGYIPTTYSSAPENPAPTDNVNTDSNTSIQEDGNTYTLASTTAPLNLRKGPDKYSEWMLTIPENAIVIVHDTSHNTWWSIEYEGNKGYSFSGYLTLLENNVAGKI